MEDISRFLLGFRNDIFKLLPMREAEINGSDNHLQEYLDALVVHAKGSLVTYPELSKQKRYLYVINDLAFLSSHQPSFARWRQIVLSSTGDINKLYLFYGGGLKDGSK